MWEVDLKLIEKWLDEQNDKTVLQILAALKRLEQEGPHLGRPLVDSVRGSAFKNMKELRPGSSGFIKIRILFIFDPKRRAILLVGGDKQQRWKRW